MDITGFTAVEAHSLLMQSVGSAEDQAEELSKEMNSKCGISTWR